MDLRQITPGFAVSPQLAPEDFAAAAAAGFRTIINNRPDDEIEPDLWADEMARMAAAAGLAYRYIPYYSGNLTPDLVTRFEAALRDCEGPVLAYCRSGTRSCYLWAMAMAGHLPTAEILATTRRAGYDATGLAPAIEDRPRLRG